MCVLYLHKLFGCLQSDTPEPTPPPFYLTPQQLQMLHFLQQNQVSNYPHFYTFRQMHW